MKTHRKDVTPAHPFRICSLTQESLACRKLHAERSLAGTLIDISCLTGTFCRDIHARANSFRRIGGHQGLSSISDFRLSKAAKNSAMPLQNIPDYSGQCPPISQFLRYPCSEGIEVQEAKGILEVQVGIADVARSF
jgi:hypothetical protein